MDIKKALATLLLASTAAVAAVAAATFPAGATAPSFLSSGQTLSSGSSLVSPNQCFTLAMQRGDGNLVIYGPGGHAIWAANSTGHPGDRLIMQTDGNLVLYSGSTPLFVTSTSGVKLPSGTKGTSYVLKMQDDGNLVVYAPGNVWKWQSRSSGSCSQTGSVASKAAAIARSKIGAHRSNFGFPSENWCADFAKWVWGQAGANTGGLTSGVASFASYGAQHSTPKVGDAVIFSADSSGTAYEHVAIVVSVNGDGTVDSVGGNERDHTSVDNSYVALDHYSAATGYSSYWGMYIAGYVSPH